MSPPRITAPWLADPALQQLMALLDSGGHQGLLVGGAVRNALMGAAPGDLDLATDARPDEVAALAAAEGLKSIPTGIEHGTITVLAGGTPFEITTFRRDVQTDGRRAVVAFSRDIAEDALRRDFTINALYARADGTVLDPLGGYPDILARHVRFIEDPARRIREDYLRILRFFRFNAWYGAELDPEGFAACAELAEGLESLSKERIGAELHKLLAAPDPAPASAAFAASGGLLRVVPGADTKALPVLVHLEGEALALPLGAALVPADPVRRLAVLGGEDPARDLRLSRADAARLALIRTAALEGMGAAETAWRHGARLALDAALVRAALLESPLPQGLAKAISTGAAAEFPVRPADLMPALSGSALGAALRRMEQDWIASGFALSAEALIGAGRGGNHRGDKRGEIP